MLTDVQKVDIRRFLNFPLFGGVPVQAFGHRFYQWYGTLEFRMNNLHPAEEQQVVGHFLPQLRQLETDLFEVRANADTDEAAVWRRNKGELAERKALFEFWQQRLALFFGMPLRMSGGRCIELVV